MAAYGCCYFSAIASGALSGFLASRFPHIDQIFDDDEHFADVEYGDNLDVYNPYETDTSQHKEVPQTENDVQVQEMEFEDMNRRKPDASPAGSLHKSLSRNNPYNQNNSFDRNSDRISV